jgi:methionyl-tRNA formyltransferase
MLKIERLQIEGKKQMDARDFLRGFKLASGMRLS